MSSMHLGKLAVLLAAALPIGCGDDHDGPSHEPTTKSDEPKSALGGLSAEDQVLARAQKTCPVGEEPLGSMGTPIKVSAGNRTVFLCCKGCRKKFEANPDKYVAKLKR